MKKLFFSMLCIIAFATTVNATTYYVTPTGSNTTGSGLSWSDPVGITRAGTLAAVSGDVIYVMGGTYNFTKSAPSATGAFGTNAGISYYGSFAGTESAPSERATSDIDGNGIVEPWEFTNQSILNFTLTGSAAGFVTSNASTIVTNINGFKFTGTNTASDFSTTNVRVTMRISKNIRFENNIVANWTVTGNITGTTLGTPTLLAAPFFDVISASGYGNTVVHNCLFEKNSITYTSTQTVDCPFHPFISLGSAQALTRNLMSNSVVRNNKETMDYSGSTATTANNLRGLLVSIQSPTASYPTTLKNTIIHNNDITFTPKSGITACYGAPVYVYNATTTVSDSIINNAIANNKTTNCSSAGIKFSMDINSPYVNPNHFIMNNVMYNNKNNGSISNFEANLAVPATSGTIVKNNICNGGVTVLTNANTNVIGNLFDLSDDNVNVTKGANFTNPTSVIGTNRVALSADSIAIAQSRWTIGATSYLKGKGITTLTTSDKAGHVYGTTPSVGAYEYASYIVTVNKNSTGSTSAVTGAGTYDFGTPVTVLATPITGILFSNWTDANGTKSTKASYTFYPTANYTITGNFIIDPSTGISKTETVDLLTINGRNIISTIPGSMEVYDSVGRLVATSSKNESITLKNGGIYIVKINTANENKVQKIFVK